MAVETPAAGGAETTTLKRQAVRGGAIFMVARLAAQLFQWSITLFVARLLLPDDYGMMTSGVLFVGLADMLAEAGVGKALIHRRQLAATDLAQGFTLSLLLSAGLYAILFIIAGPAAEYLQRPDFALFLRVLALLLFLVPLRSVAGALLERDLLLGKQSAVHLGGAVAQALLVLTLAYAGFGYWALAAGTLTGRLLETASVWYVSGWRPRLALPGREAWELLRYGMHISFASLLWFAYSNADFAVAGALLGTIQLGFYSLAFQLISLPVQKISSHVNHVMFAVFCKMQDDRVRIRDWFLRLTVLISFVAMPALAGMALVAADGIPLLLGERWTEAVLPFRLLCPVGVMMVISSATHQLLAALGRPDIGMRYNIACVALFPASFALVGWHYGLVGICLVWLTLHPFMVIALIQLTRGITGIGFLDVLRMHLPVLAGVAFMIICVLAVQGLFLGDDHAGPRLGASISTGVLAYTAWMLLTARATVLADLRLLWQELRGR